MDIVSLFQWQMGFFLPGKLFNVYVFCQEESGMLLQIQNSLDDSPHTRRSDFSWKVNSSADETVGWYSLSATHAANWVTIATLWDGWIWFEWEFSNADLTWASLGSEVWQDQDHSPERWTHRADSYPFSLIMCLGGVVGEQAFLPMSKWMFYNQYLNLCSICNHILKRMEIQFGE